MKKPVLLKKKNPSKPHTRPYIITAVYVDLIKKINLKKEILRHINKAHVMKASIYNIMYLPCMLINRVIYVNNCSDKPY